jgi:Uma2 family endonuclease
MATNISDRVYTPDDLLTMPDGDRYELVDGQLVEGDMSGLACWVMLALSVELGAHVKRNKLGAMFSSEAQYRCFAEDPNRIRKPDLSFIHRSRFSSDLMSGFIPIAPDFVVEVVSQHDTYYEVEIKVGEYLRAGVRLVWVVIPVTKTVKVYRPGAPMYEVAEGAEITGDEVLPEFRIAVTEFFEEPASDVTAEQ